MHIDVGAQYRFHTAERMAFLLAIVNRINSPFVCDATHVYHCQEVFARTIIIDFLESR